MDFRRQPELSFAVWVSDMDMDTGFFPGEEEQTELLLRWEVVEQRLEELG